MHVCLCVSCLFVCLLVARFVVRRGWRGCGALCCEDRPVRLRAPFTTRHCKALYGSHPKHCPRATKYRQQPPSASNHRAGPLYYAAVITVLVIIEAPILQDNRRKTRAQTDGPPEGNRPGSTGTPALEERRVWEPGPMAEVYLFCWGSGVYI